MTISRAFIDEDIRGAPQSIRVSQRNQTEPSSHDEGWLQGLMEATFMPMRTEAPLIPGSGTDRMERRSIGPYSEHTTAFINI
jgi:hypothetical protein